MQQPSGENAIGPNDESRHEDGSYTAHLQGSWNNLKLEFLFI